MCSTQEKEFEDTKRVIRIRKSKKNRQHNGQKKKDKQRFTKQTHKTKDQVTRTPLKTVSMVSDRGYFFSPSQKISFTRNKPEYCFDMNIR